MRGSLAAAPSDRISSFAILTAGLLCGVSVFFVALPLAQSSPFPTPKDGGWISEAPSYRLASAGGSIPVTLTEGAPDRGGSELREALGVQAAVEWEAMVAPVGVIDVPPAEVAATPEAGEEPETLAAAPDEGPVVTAAIAPAAEPSAPVVKRAVSPMDEVDDYLWEVYQRAPVKKDRGGDFTWKDPAAAKRVKMSLQDYVIRGMDRDFREQLYHAGKAMDAEGLNWSMLSAFRDDYRQGIASGFKARTGNSLHGGSRATGGYGHGRAIDIISADGDHRAVWRWIDRNRGKYGFSRPMPGADPAHIQSAGDWRRIAAKLRDGRVRVAEQAKPEPTKSAQAASARAKTKVANAGM
jgi:hypothetical protein